MATWAQFEAEAPEPAAAGRKLLYPFGPGLAFLATVRADGGPRLHPCCPVIVEGRLYAFIIDSPKQRDLLRGSRYALHTFPPAQVDDEFYATGEATRVADPAVEAAVTAAYDAQGTMHGAGEVLFEFGIERALWVEYGPRPSHPLRYVKWKAG